MSGDAYHSVRRREELSLGESMEGQGSRRRALGQWFKSKTDRDGLGAAPVVSAPDPARLHLLFDSLHERIGAIPDLGEDFHA